MRRVRAPNVWRDACHDGARKHKQSPASEALLAPSPSPAQVVELARPAAGSPWRQGPAPREPRSLAKALAQPARARLPSSVLARRPAKATGRDLSGCAGDCLTRASVARLDPQLRADCLHEAPNLLHVFQGVHVLSLADQLGNDDIHFGKIAPARPFLKNLRVLAVPHTVMHYIRDFADSVKAGRYVVKRELFPPCAPRHSSCRAIRSSVMSRGPDGQRGTIRSVFASRKATGVLEFSSDA